MTARLQSADDLVLRSARRLIVWWQMTAGLRSPWRRFALVAIQTVAATTVIAALTPILVAHAQPRPQRAPFLARCDDALGRVAATDSSSQLLTVIAPSAPSQRANVTLYQRQLGCWRHALGPFSGWIGVHGMSTHHREGDGTTPEGLFTIGATMFGTLADPGVAYPYHRLGCGDWWDENSRSGLYNRFVHVACGITPDFARGSEALWTEAPAYDYFAVINYNTAPVVSGRGSGIFLHVAHGSPTTGCVSIVQGDLANVLTRLRPTLDPLILIETASGLAQLERPAAVRG